MSSLTSYTRGATTSYGWQAVPNRDVATVNGNSTSYTFDGANRETTSSAGNIDYDTEGRLTARPGQILVWDDLGRLIQVNDASSQAVIAALPTMPSIGSLWSPRRPAAPIASVTSV